MFLADVHDRDPITPPFTLQECTEGILHHKICEILAKRVELSWSYNLRCACFHSVFLLSNGTLFISQVKPRNTGTYKCVGRGVRGSPVTLEASLLIAGVVKDILTSDPCLRALPRPSFAPFLPLVSFTSGRERLSCFTWLLFPPTIQFVELSRLLSAAAAAAREAFMTA